MTEDRAWPNMAASGLRDSSKHPPECSLPPTPLYRLSLLCLIFTTACASPQTEADTRTGLPAVSQPEAPKPNILFILTDDQGIGDLSLHGNDSIRTPNMDALIGSGAKFDRFYVSPVCAPTRASFLSGLHAPRTGAVYVTRRRETMDAAVKTIPEYLGEAGYRTGLFGKWHNGATKPYDPAGQGFDEFLGFTLGHFNDYFNGELENERNEVVPFSGDLTQILTDTAAAFMLEDAPGPFFCMLAYQAPHTPVQVADKYWGEVKKRGLSDYNTGIYAMIESIDDRMGQLLSRLEAAGKLENTVVIFSTDNGPNGDRYRMGLKGTKGHVDEGGVRVPFAIRLPGDHPANGKTFDTPAAHIDLLPTLLELTGQPVPDGLDGMSLVHLLEGGSGMGDVERAIYTFRQGYDHQTYPGGMRDSRYLYVGQSSTEHEFYDLRADPGQTNNIFDDSGLLAQEYKERYFSVAANVGRPDLVAPPIDLDATNDPVHLLAHEGEPEGETKFSGKAGWANDWFIDLDEAGAAWPITNGEERTYTAILHYNNTSGADRSVTLTTDKNTTQTNTLSPFPGTQLPVTDRTKRKEVYPRTWQTATFEAFVVPAGATELRVSGGGAGGVSIKEVTLLPVAR